MRWFFLIHRKLNRIIIQQRHIMSALEDLTAASVALTTSVDAAVAALGTAPADNSAQLAAITAQLVDAKTKLDNAVATRPV